MTGIALELTQGMREICRTTSRGREGEAEARRGEKARLSFVSVVTDELNTAADGSTAQVYYMFTTQQVVTGDIAGHWRVTMSISHGDNNWVKQYWSVLNQPILVYFFTWLQKRGHIRNNHNSPWPYFLENNAASFVVELITTKFSSKVFWMWWNSVEKMTSGEIGCATKIPKPGKLEESYFSLLRHSVARYGKAISLSICEYQLSVSE